ncbi:UNVERIFIED_CONTAM: 3-hydroxy-3-methylglutaryl-coenzyme A reductase 1 [Sesamum radiatum]|uniref:3-hydroxy-3-methylglutaryl-coenzyme A reductase 1 n=1 Tax=Sesamum radiatum TaxID=300843 RepID=A0AAW2QF85_SESRA
MDAISWIKNAKEDMERAALIDYEGIKKIWELRLNWNFIHIPRLCVRFHARRRRGGGALLFSSTPRKLLPQPSLSPPPPPLPIRSFIFSIQEFVCVFILFFYLPSQYGNSSEAAQPPSSSCTASGDAVCRKASDALPLPLYLTNAIFFTLFFSVAYFLLHRWRDKIRNSVPLHVLTLSELAAVLSLIASFIYLLGFFGIDFVQSFISKSESDDENQQCVVHEARKGRCSIPTPVFSKPATMDGSQDDEDLIKRVVAGEIPSYSLESKLGDCFKSAKIRREAVQRMTEGRWMDCLWRGLITIPFWGNAARCRWGMCRFRLG